MQVKLVKNYSVCLGIKKRWKELDSGTKVKAIDIGDVYLIYIDGDVSIISKDAVKELS